jgi:GTP-binding protein
VLLLFPTSGKTTLVDSLLVAARRSSGAEASSLNRLMDSGELEIERGITITSKVTRFAYKDQIINCVDTPGHADFCGEVDRILSKFI